MTFSTSRRIASASAIFCSYSSAVPGVLSRLLWMALLVRTDGLLGFVALAMMASAVKVGLRKKEKANRPSELQKILLGCYIKLRPRSQESCVYLGIVQLRHGKPMN